SMAGECGRWLVQFMRFVDRGCRFSLERFLFLFARSPRRPAHTPIRACDRNRSSNLINAISTGRGTQRRAQSNPTLAKSIPEQVRYRAAPAFQSGFNVSLGVVSFLFPSNN